MHELGPKLGQDYNEQLVDDQAFAAVKAFLEQLRPFLRSNFTQTKLGQVPRLLP